MAKYVIAGKSNCPFYARVELLADELQQRLPEFSVHKIRLVPDEWNQWVGDTCKEMEWDYDGKSPLIWRELVHRGGKGVLVGSLNEFLEIAKGYYGLSIEKLTDELTLIAEENKTSKVAFDKQEEKRTTCPKPFRITVTNSRNPLIYNFLPHLGSSSLSNNDIFFTLYSPQIEEEDGNLDGISMELFDCANSSVRKVFLEGNVDEAFIDANLVVIVNTGEINKETIVQLKKYGEALNKASRDVKVVVTGHRPMVACYIISQTITRIPKENIFALSRMQENKVKSLVAKKLCVTTSHISNVIIWGSSIEYVLYHSIASASAYDGAVWAPHLVSFSHSVNEMIYDKEWLSNELPTVLETFKPTRNSESGATVNFQLDKKLTTQQIENEKEVAAALTRKDILAHTAALISQLEDLLKGVKQENIFSLGLVSNGSYGIPEGLVFSVPYTITFGQVAVKKDIVLDEEMQTKISGAALKLKEYCDGLLNL